MTITWAEKINEGREFDISNVEYRERRYSISQ